MALGMLTINLKLVETLSILLLVEIDFRSYYFTQTEMCELAERTGFSVLTNGYVNRRTVNVKENVDAPRIFLQCKLSKNKI